MTDIWCFTCDHELRQKLFGGYEHLEPDEESEEECVCVQEGLACEPR